MEKCASVESSQMSVVSSTKHRFTLVYEGEWREGKRHGQGFESFADQVSIYFGIFKRDRPHGKGCFINTKTGDRFSGDWY